MTNDEQIRALTKVVTEVVSEIRQERDEIRHTRAVISVTCILALIALTLDFIGVWP